MISLESSLKKQLRLEIAQERSNLTTRIAAASAALTLSEQELAKEAIPLRKHLAELQALRRDVGDFSVEVRCAGDLGSGATV